jgi:FAD/FMN-containing dehydrogenase
MGSMNKILDISIGTVTAEAGALYIDVAKELEKQNLQFYVNTEIGNLSVGSAACSGTKDSSMPGEYGQVGSYVSRIKMALPSGDLLEVTDDQPDLMQQVRSSYGTFGIVCEATFRVRPIQPMAVRHQTFTLDDFIQKLPSLKAWRRIADVLHFPLRQPDHGGISQVRPQCNRCPESRHMAAAQLFVGQCRTAGLR